MQSKNILTRILLTIPLGICLVIIFFFIYSVFGDEIKNIFSFLTPKTSQAEYEQKIFSPTRLRIPVINIDTNIEHIGLTKSGEIDVPINPQNVGWFSLGIRPGDLGSAVIDGHSGYKNNKPVAFDSLHKLKKGDKVYIEDELGVTTTFMVRVVRNYGKNENVPKVFVSHDGKSHLNLITCAGIWNVADKTHSSRLVVFTDKLLE